MRLRLRVWLSRPRARWRSRLQLSVSRLRSFVIPSRSQPRKARRERARNLGSRLCEEEPRSLASPEKTIFSYLKVDGIYRSQTDGLFGYSAGEGCRRMRSCVRGRGCGRTQRSGTESVSRPVDRTQERCPDTDQ